MARKIVFSRWTGMKVHHCDSNAMAPFISTYLGSFKFTGRFDHNVIIVECFLAGRDLLVNTVARQQ